MQIQTGYLLISDITGYTRFLVSSELAHAKEILDSLLQTTIDAIEPPVRLLNTRGDAVVAFVADDGFLQPQSLLESIRGIYFDFRRKLSFMDLNTTCDCNACVNMGSLDLKLFLHHGEYIEQDIDGATELQGADVILVNLLLKNGVKEATGLAGYALLTDAAVAAMGAGDLVSSPAPPREEYEHFGDVGMRVWDLPAEWNESTRRRRAERDPARKWVVESIDTSVAPWIAWDRATDKDEKREYYGMISVDRVDDLGGPVGVGSQYHCVHEQGDVRFTITDWDPPHAFESDEVAFDIPVHFTMEVLPSDTGSTLRVMYDEPKVENPAELESLFRDAAKVELQTLAKRLDDDAQP
jgi:hypothetical protein